MKIVLISMVRNEADVIELFVRYHAEFVDELLIIDHRSLDDTHEILSQLSSEGLPIRFSQIGDPAFDQAKHMTRLMHRAATEYGADWVLPLDADEFLTTMNDTDLRSTIEGLSPTAPALVAWRTYVPTDEDPADEPNLLRRMTHRREAELEQEQKVLVPGALAQDPKVVLGVGNHRLKRWGWRRRAIVEPIETLALVNAHFPLRSVEQATLKGLVAWPSLVSDSQYPPKIFWNQKRMFDDILSGEASSREWLTQLASTYALKLGPDDDRQAPVKLVDDPVREPVPIELRWPNPNTINPLSVVAEMAERIAGQLGDLRRAQRKKRALWARPRRP